MKIQRTLNLAKRPVGRQSEPNPPKPERETTVADLREAVRDLKTDLLNGKPTETIDRNPYSNLSQQQALSAVAGVEHTLSDVIWPEFSRLTLGGSRSESSISLRNAHSGLDWAAKNLYRSSLKRAGIGALSLTAGAAALAGGYTIPGFLGVLAGGGFGMGAGFAYADATKASGYAENIKEWQQALNPEDPIPNQPPTDGALGRVGKGMGGALAGMGLTALTLSAPLSLAILGFGVEDKLAIQAFELASVAGGLAGGLASAAMPPGKNWYIPDV